MSDVSEKYPVTPAVHALRQAHVPFLPHLYTYVEKGGTANSSRALGVAEHEVVKTLVMEDDRKQPLIILMHGDREVSTKQLARAMGAKSVHPCDPAVAQKHSGYQVGGTSPFGTRKPLPIYMEKSILALPRLFVNGGSRGFLVELAPPDLARVLNPTLVEVAIVPGT